MKINYMDNNAVTHKFKPMIRSEIHCSCLVDDYEGKRSLANRRGDIVMGYHSFPWWSVVGAGTRWVSIARCQLRPGHLSIESATLRFWLAEGMLKFL